MLLEILVVNFFLESIFSLLLEFCHEAGLHHSLARVCFVFLICDLFKWSDSLAVHR